MAITCTSLTHGSNVTGVSSATTASISPTTNQLVIITINSRNATVDPNQATVTGCGLTWVQIVSNNYDNTGSQKRETMLRALGTPSSGTLTIDFASQVQSDIHWTVDTFTGMDTSGTNGSGAIVQNAVNQDRTGAGTSLTATLSAFGSTNNATYGVGVIGNTGETITQGTGFTKIDTETGGTNLTTFSQFRNDNSTSVGYSVSVAGELGVIGVEIKAAASAVNSNFLAIL